MINFKWKLADLKKIADPSKNLTCMSAFSGGGGSSLGYKLAGIDVIANCEIDKKQNALYLENCKPQHTYEMDIKKLVALAKDKELPAELYQLDILDGSPPCTLFSVGNLSADKHKGKKKQFKEGQAEQVLDELFYDFIELVDVLQPKMVIAENVKGLLQEKNIKYVRSIVKTLENIGYKVTYQLLDASLMSVPQKRQRVFFIAVRNDITTTSADLFDQELKLDLAFNSDPIYINSLDIGEKTKKLAERCVKYMPYYKPQDKKLSAILLRHTGKEHGFDINIYKPADICGTLVAGSSNTIIVDNLEPLQYRQMSCLEMIQAQTFPADYNFLNKNIEYTLGMSVPPLMIYHLINKILKQINLN